MVKRVRSVVIAVLMLFSFVIIIVDIAPKVGAPTTWYVDDVPGGSPPEDFTSIQDAVNASKPGDTVYVYSGIYYEHVYINKTINLTGEDTNTTVVNGSGSGYIIHIDNVDYVNVTGFTVEYGESGIYLGQSSYSNISKNRVRGILGIFPVSHGINVVSSSYSDIYGNEIYDCEGSGVYSWDSSYNNFINNIVHDLRGSQPRGFFFSGTPYYNNKIIGNIVYNTHDGIRLETQSSPSLWFWDNWIINNTVYNYESDGIGIHSGYDNFIIGNIVYNATTIPINPRGGITISSSNDTSVIGNVVYNSVNGILLGQEVSGYPASRNTFRNNTVYNNENGIRLNRAQNNMFIENAIFNNNKSIGMFNPDWMTTAYGGIGNNFINCTLTNAGINVYMKRSSDNNFINCNLSNATTNVYIKEQSDDNNFINCSLSNATINVHIEQQSNGSNFINCSLSDATINVNIEQQSNSTNFINCSLSNVTTNVYIEQQSNNTNFINCTLSSATIDDYNLTQDSHAILLNTTFNKTKVAYGDELSSLTVKWFMHVKVVYSCGNPVKDANVNVRNVTYDLVADRTTGLDGRTKWIVCTEYIQNKTGEIYHTPHNATGTKYGITGYAVPEPFMNKSKTVTIVLYNGTVIDLEPGWNLVSLPRILSDSDIETVLQSIEGDYDSVQFYNVSDNIDHWKIHHVGKLFGNDLFQFNHTMGFWLHVTDPEGTTLVILGDKPTSNQSIQLYPGWNLVGYPSLTSYNRTEATTAINFGSDVDSIWTFNATTQRWKELGPDDYFELGRGYWVHAKTECVWEVPL